MSLTAKGQVDYWLKLSNESLLDMRAALRSGRRVNAFYFRSSTNRANYWVRVP